MIRARLKNRFIIKLYLTKTHKEAFAQSCYERLKEDYFSNKKPNLCRIIKSFWQTIKPCFPDKGNFSNMMMISDFRQFVTIEDYLVICNEHFVNINKTLDLYPSMNFTTTILPEIIEAFEHHPNVKKKNFLGGGVECQFKFDFASENDFRKIFSNMEEINTPLNDDIPAEILKSCVDSCISILLIILSTYLERGCFPSLLQLAEVTPVFKKKDI